MFKSYSDIFSRRAQSYHEAMSTWPDARNQEFHKLISQIPIRRAASVCDVPAGGGYLANYLRPLDVSYTAIETAQYFFEQCPVVHEKSRVFSQLNSIDLADGQFDIVFSLAGLHHIEDRSQVYQELHRLLKPSGKLVIADVQKDTPSAFFLNEFVNHHNSMGHEGLFLDNRDLQSLRQSGFSLTRSKQESYYWNFPSVDAMATYCQLMFGLDQASRKVIIMGISEYLGYLEQNSIVQMNWSLQFLTALKVASD